MDRVNKLKESAGAASVKFMEFMRVSSKNPDTVICVFEGEDEKYYSPRLTVYLNPLEWHGINAGGKKNVIALFNLISSHPIYQKSRFLCFVDKDFESWWVNPCSEKIYQTPCYSIENLYMSEQVFKRVLSSEFQITEFNESSSEFEKCTGLFSRLKGEYFQIATPFNITLKAFRIMQRDEKESIVVNANNIKINKLISLTLDGVVPAYDLENALELFREATNANLCPDSYAEASASLMAGSQENDFRGKQNADFFRLFLSALKSDRVSDTPVFFPQRKPVKLNLSRENFISELSQYASTPDCLVSFLTNYREAFAA